MGSQRNFNVAVNELESYITAPKLITDQIQFVHIPRQSKRSPHGFKHWQSSYIVSVENHDTIDGLILTLKSSIIYNDRYYSFMLGYRYQDALNVIHQLEVYPDDYPSHREIDGQQIFGTHIHHLNTTSSFKPNGYHRFTWYDWFDCYRTIINLSIDGQIYAPDDGELFI